MVLWPSGFALSALDPRLKLVFAQMTLSIVLKGWLELTGWFLTKFPQCLGWLFPSNLRIIIPLGFISIHI